MPTFRFGCRVAIAITGVLMACALSACQSGDASTKTTAQRSIPGIAAVPSSDLGLSVDEAYAAIPHRRTAMQFPGSNVPKADQDYLQVAFAVIDQAVLLRVATYQSFLRGKTADPLAISRMDRLIAFLHSVDPPAHLKTYHKRIEQALADQRAFFDDWRSRGSEFPYARGSLASHPKVASSSSALKEAYGILMQSYPSESAHNREAFFDYHCALDFL